MIFLKWLQNRGNELQFLRTVPPMQLKKYAKILVSLKEQCSKHHNMHRRGAAAKLTLILIFRDIKGLTQVRHCRKISKQYLVAEKKCHRFPGLTKL